VPHGSTSPPIVRRHSSAVNYLFVFSLYLLHVPWFCFWWGFAISFSGGVPFPFLVFFGVSVKALMLLNGDVSCQICTVLGVFMVFGS
jgi:hypothetical protein